MGYINGVSHKFFIGQLRMKWHGMLQRCYNPKNASYHWYGERGITVCDEWKNSQNGFYNFLIWAIKTGWDGKLTIDRIDNDKGYAPDNCQWLTKGENSRKALLDRYRKQKERKITESDPRVSRLIAALLILAQVDKRELSKQLGISYDELSKKFRSGAFSAKELANIIEFTGAKFQFNEKSQKGEVLLNGATFTLDKAWFKTKPRGLCSRYR